MGEGGVEDEAPGLAKKIHTFVLAKVNGFRSDLKPPAPPRDKHHLPDFDQILRDFFKGGRRRDKVPPPKPRDVHVEPANRQEVEVDPTDASGIRTKAECTFSLTEVGRQKVLADGRDATDVKIIFSFRFEEDGRIGSAEDSRSTVRLAKPVKGFKDTHAKRSLVLEGSLGINAEETVFLHTDAYDPDLAGRIIYTADLVSTPSVSEADRDGSDG